MKVKKIIEKTVITATILAVTIPLSHAACKSGCPISELKPTNTSQCANKEESTTSKQSYAYPEAVYGNSDSSLIGDNNSTVIGDSRKNSKGVFLQNSSHQTGAAANIIGKSIFDKINSPCSCNNNPAIQSPTSMEVTKKTIEALKLNNSGHITGAAANLNTIYPDVRPNYWAASEINHLTDKCVVEGYPSGLFKPNGDITRAELASMVVKGYNMDDIALSPDGDFSDVGEEHWAYKQINRASTSGMISGYSDNEFKPNSFVTKAEAMTIMSKGIKCPIDSDKTEKVLSRYSDSNKVPNWARESVASAIDNGILNYTQHSKKLNPNENISRAEVATMLQNMRLALGYDAKIKTANNNMQTKTFAEKEVTIKIPTLELTMHDMINSKNTNVGEQFAASTINPITIGGNTFPSGSRVNGKVTEIIRPTRNTQGAIKLSFNEIIGSDGTKYSLPKQVLTARVENDKSVNGFARAIQWPFTWTGSLIGTVGRSAGGMLIGVGNASESVLDNFGVGSSELLTGNFKASGRSFQDSGKALVKAPVDFTRTALSGTLGIFQTTADEVAYLIDAKGQTISQVNPNQKVTIAFGE